MDWEWTGSGSEADSKRTERELDKLNWIEADWAKAGPIDVDWMEGG